MEVGTAELGGMQSTVQSWRDEMRKAKAHLELNKVMLWLQLEFKLQTATSFPRHPLQWERDKKAEITGWGNNLLEK